MRKIILLGLVCFFALLDVAAQIHNVYVIDNKDIGGYYMSENLANISFSKLKGTELIVRPYYKNIVEMKESYSDRYYSLYEGEQIPLIIRSRIGYISTEKEEKKGVYGCSERKIWGVLDVQYKYYTEPYAIMSRIIVIEGRSYLDDEYFEIKIKPYTESYYLYLGRGFDFYTQISDYKRMQEFDKLFYNYSYAKALKKEYITDKKNKKERTYVATATVTGTDVDTQLQKNIQKNERFYLQDMVLTETDDDLTLMAVLASDSSAVYVPFEKIDFAKNNTNYFISEYQLELNRIAAATQKQAQIDSLTAAEQRENSLKAKYGSQLAQKIISKELALDMTTEMCLAAWGAPNDKHRTITKTKTTEIWEYPHDRLIFEDDKLISIEQTSLLKVNR